MTKKTPTAERTLYDLKIAVVNFHKGNEFEYLRNQIAKDACYTSHNSLMWKQGQMADIKAEIADLAEASGSEVVDVKLDKKIALYQAMEPELDEMSMRHTADCAVYLEVSGEAWTARPKRTFKSDGLGRDAALAKILAA